MRNENLLWRYFHTEITSGNHDTIRGFENLIIVLKTFLILNLRDNLYSLAFISHEVPDILNITGFPNKRGSNEVNSLIQSKVHNIKLVLLGEGWQVHNSSWQVHIFSFTKLAAVLANDIDKIITKFGDLSS